MSDLNVKGGPLVDTGPGIGPLILGLNWTFASIAIIAVSLRMWLRRKVGWAVDDWLMVFATALLVVYEALISTAVRWGLGKDTESVTLAQYKQFQYWSLIAQFFINSQPIFSRISIAIFLTHIFGTARPWFKHFLVVFLVVLAISAILANILTYTYLDPLEAYWNPTIKPKYRFNPYVEYWVADVENWLVAVSDIAFAVIPITFVWNLNLPRVKKVGLIAIFGGSLIAFFATTARALFATLEILQEIGNVSGKTTTGVLWITAGVEQSLVIILGTAPSLGPIAHLRLVNNLFESLAYLVTLGRRSRRSSASQSVYNEELEMGQPKRLSEGEEVSAKPALEFADDTLASVNHETAKYVRRGDDFIIRNKTSRGQLN